MSFRQTELLSSTDKNVHVFIRWRHQFSLSKVHSLFKLFTREHLLNGFNYNLTLWLRKFSSLGMLASLDFQSFKVSRIERETHANKFNGLRSHAETIISHAFGILCCFSAGSFPIINYFMIYFLVIVWFVLASNTLFLCRASVSVAIGFNDYRTCSHMLTR